MKTNLLKSFITILFALIISQQSIHAQKNRTARFEAQLKLYDIVEELSVLKGVDFGGIQFENISYDCETLKMDIIISTSQSDIRYLTSDMFTLQVHNFVNSPKHKESYTTLASLLRQTDSKWQITYKDTQGHAVSHSFTAPEVEDLLNKPIEELGIDKEQMSNYCIFYHNNIFQSQVDGVEVLAIKVSKAEDFVKIAIQTAYDNETIKGLTPELIKTVYISTYNSPILAKGYANQLKAFGYKGIILEYYNQQGDTAKSTITLDDFHYFYDEPQLGSQDIVEEDVFEAYDTIIVDSIAYIEIVDDSLFNENKMVKDMEEVQENEPQLKSYDLSQNSYVLDIIEQYKKYYQSSIGINGILDIKVELIDPYIAITIFVDEVNDNAGNYAPNSYKEDYIANTILSDERIEQYKLLYAEGVKGFYMTITNAYDYITFSVPIDFDEIFSAKYTFSQAPEQSLEDYLASLSEDEKQSLANEYMRQIEAEANSSIGHDGITNAHTYLANSYINIIYTINSIENFTDEFIYQSKINFIKYIKPRYTAEIVTTLKYVLEAKGYNFIYTDATTHKSVSLTIDFDEILYFNDNTTYYNESYDFSDLNTDEIINEIISEFDKSMRHTVGQNGLTDIRTRLSNNLIESTFIFDHTFNINDIVDINDFKRDLVKEMTATQDDLDTWGALYYLGIDGFKFIFKNTDSENGKWFSVTIEDVINGIENLDAIPLNEI